jgi:hypothetical protein
VVDNEPGVEASNLIKGDRFSLDGINHNKSQKIQPVIYKVIYIGKSVIEARKLGDEKSRTLHLAPTIPVLIYPTNDPRR